MRLWSSSKACKCIQIGACKSQICVVQVLGNALIPGLSPAENVLHYVEYILYFTAHSGFPSFKNPFLLPGKAVPIMPLKCPPLAADFLAALLAICHLALQFAVALIPIAHLIVFPE